VVVPTETLTPQPTAAKGDTQVRSINGMVMVYVPAGEFGMGSDEDEIVEAFQLCREYYHDWSVQEEWFEGEAPEHTVALSGFWLD
jgi:formylglycine-generating enzyme required for sulfatase activity